MKVDLRQESEIARSERIMNFLLVLQYKGIPTLEDDRLDWTDGLGSGETQVIYPILQWILTMYDKLCKRAYLAPFLRPVEIPMEYLMQDQGEDSNSGTTLSELAQRYRQLQQEFKETHKRYEVFRAEIAEEPEQGSLPSSPSSPFGVGGTLKKEIAQLEDEKRQLKERIEALQNKTNNTDDQNINEKQTPFSTMLEATSQFRQEQDEEIRLQDRMKDQRHYLAMSEQKLHQTRRRLSALQSSMTMSKTNEAGSSDTTATNTDHILKEMKKEVDEMNRIVRTEMIKEKRKLQERLVEVEKERMEPKRTEIDVEDIQMVVSQLEDQCKKIEIELEVINGGKKQGGYDKLKMFKQVRNYWQKI